MTKKEKIEQSFKTAFIGEIFNGILVLRFNFYDFRIVKPSDLNIDSLEEAECVVFTGYIEGKKVLDENLSSELIYSFSVDVNTSYSNSEFKIEIVSDSVSLTLIDQRY